jgi:ATP-dependent Clp protease ATP-binding subunit ClpA
MDALRANARTIVLFEKIEKAHPSILRVLMNAMDAGRLSTASRSSTGHEVDCRHAVFMFTSNVDAKSILDELESRSAFGNRAVENEVCRRRLHAGGIAPEVVGRIGRFLVFRPFSPQIRAEIVTLAIAEVADEYGLRVAYVEPGVVVDLMQKARSQKFGVRPELFLIDDVLGGAFARVAAQGINTPVTVGGPPYECWSNAPGMDGDDAQRNDTTEQEEKPEYPS